MLGAINTTRSNKIGVVTRCNLLVGIHTYEEDGEEEAEEVNEKEEEEEDL